MGNIDLEKNKSIVRSWMKAADDADRETWMALTHPEHEQAAEIDAAAGEGGVMGRDQHWAMIEKLLKVMTVKHDIQNLYAEGDTVIAKGTGYAENLIDGTKGTMEFAIFVTIKDGLVYKGESVGTALRPVEQN